MTILMSVFNPDRETGKSVSALNLAFSFSVLEKKTLLIGYDPLSEVVANNSDMDDISFNLLDCILGNTSPSSVVANNHNDYFFYIPSTPDLAKCESSLSENAIKEKVFEKVFKSYQNLFDYVIIDTPSNNGFLTVSAFTAANYVITPLSSGKMIKEQLLETLTLIKYVRNKFNKNIRFGGIFINRDFPELLVEGDLSQKFGNSLFKTAIPYCRTTAEASNKGFGAGLLDIKSEGASAYLKLAIEIMETL